MINHWSRLIAFVAALFFSTGWNLTAHAAPIVVDWDVTPHMNQSVVFGDSPYYDCFGIAYGERHCNSLWDEGLELGKVTSSFFDDKFFDAFGLGVDEDSIAEGSGFFRIRPVCKSGLSPCFDAFTPLTLNLFGDTNTGLSPNIFVLSSRGGLMKAPSAGSASFILAGSAWEDLEWIEMGLYLPSACKDDPPRDDDSCRRDREKALVVKDLTFEPVDVPEPALAILLATGVASARRRARLR